MLKWLLILLLCNLSLEDSAGNTDCVQVSRGEEPLLILSTLSGALIAIDPLTAETRWIQEDEPNIRAENQINDSSHVYLADPTSGSLYKLQSNSETRNQLTKLPYTIPELVQRSPCKSSDGILYSGKKKDSWIIIDPFTGVRETVMGFDPPKKQSESIGFATSRAVYLGRTQYTVQMFDSTSKDTNSQFWNVTFFDYNSATMDEQLMKKYEFIHVTSSTTGKIVTINRKTSGFLWEKLDVDSPIVQIFILTREGFLNVPFTTVAEEVIDNVAELSKSGDRSDFELIPTVFIGENKGKGSSMYAIPAYVDDNVPTIRNRKKNLIGGPVSTVPGKSQHRENEKKLSKLDYILFGYYENFETAPLTDGLSGGGVKTGGREISVHHRDNSNFFGKSIDETREKIILPDESDLSKQQNVVINQPNMSDVTKDGLIADNKFGMLKTFVMKFKHWFDNEENNILKLSMIVLFGIIISMFWYFHTTVRELRQQSQNGSKTFSNGSSSSGSNSGVHYGEDEIVEIGKITFKPSAVLGKGCEGTFVFKGRFEEREVAVKRLLPQCFTLADREVTLLRESDTHENVVRYFCTESDRQFKYIAVELCAATLQDFVESKDDIRSRLTIPAKEIMYQATRGLSHLHSLNIVHRDIKPQNVLISFPDNTNKVRALISDFGLCKKIGKGKASFSKKSGITGTEGWIAPEMLKGNRTTIAVDIFSMGCVYYYVLSNGHHLFGEPLKRQANILSHEFDMAELKKSDKNRPHESILALQLIEDMIARDPSKRPKTESILKHPLWWREEKILSFFQDLSDRVEKLDIHTDPLRTLERNAKKIIRDDWKQHLDENLKEDLRRHRDYIDMSVRDLLRALRNKKHHYHELSPELQKVLGSVPVDFTKYWIVRFPELLSHAYHAMEICSKENSFKRYYTPKFVFTKPDYLSDESLDNFQLREIIDANRQAYNKSPKKENRQPNNNGTIPSKRGSYNFNTNGAASTFITRGDMVTVNRGKKKPKEEENIVWTLPKNE